MSSGQQAAHLAPERLPPPLLPTTTTISSSSSSSSQQPRVKPCNECSRLKLKCSRAPWPCQSCRQRSLSHLCPDGQLSTRPYKKRKTLASRSRQGTSSVGSGKSSHAAKASSSSPSPLGTPADAEVRDPRQVAHSITPKYRRDVDQAYSGHDLAPVHCHRGDHGAATVAPSESPEGRGSSGILFLADHALSRSRSRPERPLLHASSSAGEMRPHVSSRTTEKITATSAHPSSHVKSGGNEQDVDRADHQDSPPPRSRRPSEDAGLLIENEQGTYSFYGPQSHSYNLAQLFADRPSPSLALPPLRRVNTELPSSMNREEGTSPIYSHPFPTAREDFSSRPSFSRGPRGSESPHSNARAIQEHIFTNPAQFLAMPGAPSPLSRSAVCRRLRASLPPASSAKRAFWIYRRNVAWLYDPLPLLSSLWDEIYGNEINSGRASLLRLALVFGVLCLGCLFDVGHPPRHQTELEERSDTFFQRAWAACLASNITDSPLLEQVQVIQILSQYLCNRSNGSRADSSFPLIGMAMRTAVTLGLHRGAVVRGGRLSEEELQERHQAFWELYSQDAFRSLAYGRPCSIQDAHVDTPFPTHGLDKSSLARIFHDIKYETARLLNQILDVGQRTQSPAYADILAFDRSLRRLWGRLPARFRPSGARGCLESVEEAVGMDENLDVLGRPLVESELQILLQGNTAIANISQTLLHLHRPWFVRALRSKKSGDRSKEFDILDSPYARSVVAVSESSRSLIDVAQSMLEAAPTLSKSWNYVWHHCFNAAVCQCLHTLQEPNSVSALGAWDDVRRALSILRQARPDRSDIVWAGKLDLLEALQRKTEERLTDNVSVEGLAENISRRQSIAERHLSLVGGGGVTNGVHRKRKEQHKEAMNGHEEARPADLTMARVPLSTADEREEDDIVVSSSAGYPSVSSSESARQPSPMSMMTATPTAEEWLNTLSDDLAGFLTSRQQQNNDLPAAATDPDGTVHWQQSSNWASSNADAEGTNATSPSLRSIQAPSTIDPSQSWNTLLTDLLQVGCEPDANFWAAITRDNNR